MNRFFHLVAYSLVFWFLAGCGETEESKTIQEARKVHNELNRVSGELHDAMQASLSRIEADIEERMASGDSAMAIQLAKLESQLGELDVRFHDWNATVVGIPGDACDHDHGHGHDEPHGHDHDHSHDHDHAVSLEGMSDEAILEIQQALALELGALKATYDSIAVQVPE